MKNTDEIAEYVFKKRDEILAKRRNNIKKTAAVLSAAACVGIVITATVKFDSLFTDNKYTAELNEVTEYASFSEISGTDKHNNQEDDKTNYITESETDKLLTETLITENNLQTSEQSAHTKKTSEETSEKPHIQNIYSEPSVTKIPSAVTEIPDTAATIQTSAYITRIPADPAVTEKPATTTEAQTDISVTETSEESAAISSWTELEISEKFIELFYDGTEYFTRCFKTESSRIDIKLGDTVIERQDFQTMEMYQADVSVFTLKNISDKCAVAVRFKNSSDYYVYTARNYFPENLNELLCNISYEENINFGDLYVNQSTEKAESYDKDVLMNIIKENRAANCVIDEASHKVMYSISTSADNLGIKNKYTAVTEDGWLIMNIMDWRYSFYIGTDAVREFGKTVRSGTDNRVIDTNLIQEME